jgi:hypothetical protein
VTAIARNESTSTFPSGVNVSKVDFNDAAALKSALSGQDFLMITLSASAPPDLHTRIVSAAIAAGVPYIMPNAYGYDVLNPTLAKEEMYTSMSLAKCKEVEELGGKWIGMTCGCWYEWHAFKFLGTNSFGIEIENREVTFFDEGKVKLPMSTWNRCGEALAALLSLPEEKVKEWSNKTFKFDSFELSQRDMLDSLNRVMGLKDEDWTIKYEKSEERVKQGLEALKEGNRLGFAKAMYSSFFNEKGDAVYGTCNEILGLKREDLDVQTDRIVNAVLKA